MAITKSRYANVQLDTIFDIEHDGQRYAALEEWIKAGENDASEDDRVLLKTHDGKPWTFDYLVGGKQFVVGPNGRRVRRRHAANLLERYGSRGDQTYKDQASGYDEMGWAGFKATKPEQAAALAILYKRQGHWPQGEPMFITSYLTHIVDEAEAEA